MRWRKDNRLALTYTLLSMGDKFLPLDLAMDEVMKRWPQTIPVLLHYQMGCVGCSMSPFDTLADAIRIYNLPEDQFIKKLCAVIQPDQTG